MLWGNGFAGIWTPDRPKTIEITVFVRWPHICHRDPNLGFYMKSTEEILYTDGQDVVITLSTLQVRDRFYRMKSIRKFGLTILEPFRLPGIVIFLIGALLAFAGMASAMPADILPDVMISGQMIDANTLAVWLGAILSLAGLLFVLLVRQRYAVRIATVDGEKNAVVSTRKEYVDEIVSALTRVKMMLDVEISSFKPRLRQS